MAGQESSAPRAVKGEPHRLTASVVSRLRLVKRRPALSAALHARGALQQGAVMIWGTFALAFAAAFTGASFYVNWVEQPARLKLEDQALLSEWGPSDSRGVSLLIALALVSAIAGFIAYFESQDVRWAFGALIIIASWLYAFFVMSPLDHQIRSLRDGGAGPRSPVGHRRIGADGDRGSGGPGLSLGPPLSGARMGFGSPSHCARAWRDIADALRFFTRLRVGDPKPSAPLDIDRIAWAAPIAGV